MRAISVDRMSYKDASAKQTRDYCDFNHFNAPIYYGTSIVDPGFGPASWGRKMVSADAPPWALVSRYPGQSSPAIAARRASAVAATSGTRASV